MKHLDKLLLFALMAVFGQGGALAMGGNAPGQSNAVTRQSNKGAVVKGKVVDVNGDPIIGASVMEGGTTNGSITDIDGNFTLNASSANTTLTVTYVGFTPQQVKAQNGQVGTIVLKEDTHNLQELVVVGYGTQKKENLTGAVSAINGDDIAKRPVANAQVMLQGQVPGLRVNQGYGQPGSEGVSFRIRGQGTFSSAGSDPLILINGVPGDMSALDPSVIESVSVLKDAASAAIYGARAANGVILITTKEGTQGKTHISYHGNVGLHSATRLYNRVNNSVEYMELANMARKNSNLSELYPGDVIEAYRKNGGSDKYPNFDWQDYMFRTAAVQTHNLNMTGGTDKATYNVALNYVNQPGTMRGFDYKKYNATVDFTAKLTDFIRFGTYTNMLYGEIDQPRQGQSDAFLSTLSQAPTYMPWLPDDGSGLRRWTCSAYPAEEHNKNMVAIIGDNAMRRRRNFDINTQMWVEVNLLKGLTWYTKGAARLRSGKEKDWIGSPTPIYNYHTGAQSGTLDKGGAGLTVSDNRVFYTNFYTYLRYDLGLMDNMHNISAMIGYNQENEKTETLGAYRKDYAFNLPTINAGGTANWSNNGGEEEWAIQSVFGRLNYNYKERYLFEANVRYDGTSRISSENRWGVFPSFSGAWRVTEEPFMQKLNYGWLNNLKLRASWGQLGNQNIGLYPYQAMIDHVGDYPFSKTTDGVVTGYQQTAYANRDIKWETTTITDIGFDLQVLDGLSITFDWYKKETKDILRASQVSSLLGLSAPTVNNGTVTNTGIELSLNYSNMVRSGLLSGLRYNAGLYFDRSRNELTKFGAEETSGYYIRREGLPYNEYYMLECIGVFADQEEIKNSPKQYNDDTQPGDLKYKDISGPDGKPDNKINDYDRRTFSGRFPGFEYGVNASASWKGFDLSLIGQGVADKKFFTNGWGVQPFIQGSAPNRDYIDGMWTEKNPNGAKHPKLYWSNLGGSKNTRANSYLLKDASYFRLKNITFGYTLPKAWTSQLELSRVRIYFSGDNLLTITSYKGLDPERAGDGRDAMYPQNKIYSFGINVEF